MAVIGTGSTASQLVPPIAEQAAQLHGVPAHRELGAAAPGPAATTRSTGPWRACRPTRPRCARFWYRALEWGRRGFDEGSLARRGMLRTAEAHLRRQVPDEALRAKLRPPYPLGCKRLIYSNDFYPALARPNVELVTEAIARITPQGIVTADGRERTIDALVCATGFDIAHLASSLQVTGRGGRTLAEAWRDGAQAWHGITAAGFPNLFMLLGPNTTTGHTSTLLYIEPQVGFTIEAMLRVKRQGSRWIEVRDDAMRAHNRELQSRLQGSVWAGCRSWYRQDGDGRIVALWPGFTREYVAALRRPDFAAFDFG